MLAGASLRAEAAARRAAFRAEIEHKAALRRLADETARAAREARAAAESTAAAERAEAARTARAARRAGESVAAAERAAAADAEIAAAAASLDEIAAAEIASGAPEVLVRQVTLVLLGHRFGTEAAAAALSTLPEASVLARAQLAPLIAAEALPLALTAECFRLVLKLAVRGGAVRRRRRDLIAVAAAAFRVPVEDLLAARKQNAVVRPHECGLAVQELHAVILSGDRAGARRPRPYDDASRRLAGGADHRGGRHRWRRRPGGLGGGAGGAAAGGLAGAGAAMSASATAGGPSTGPVKRFRPSNGTGLDFFYAAWCARCWREADPASEHECSILTRTLVYSVEDPEYPDEWRYAEGSVPVCTAFADLAGDRPHERCPDTPDLFAGVAA